ncbi:methyltransferase family protein [Propionivibrio dicarboxylicus]|uniref:Protein-S-isoprenylcysteine O-methyltransferase Ste14 n=1 Tax=Propionivibrio dicarboxylicus TaxID=83767 RepID=A0A1G8GAV1_9RHOO|nr:isoprenylcysteine carboxylmethyltransferase family protein [Propionivibrio dicarboxylicus]SDH91532.1 Protein-S-isoprenylcysteine O-methyltransferase Ste14 [Propionivibrio dicarboxylicus]
MTLELKLPPPAVSLICGAGMWLGARAVPTLNIDWPGLGALAVLLALAGFGIDLAGLLAFRRQRTTVNPLSPHAASALVCTGIYRISRNPMYLGQVVFLAAWAAWLGNPIALIGLPACAAYLTRFQILPEERILAEKFGETYADYRRRVRRWI